MRLRVIFERLNLLSKNEKMKFFIFFNSLIIFTIIYISTQIHNEKLLIDTSSLTTNLDCTLFYSCSSIISHCF